MTSFEVQIIVSLVSALLARGLAGAGAVIAMRDSLTRMDQRLKDHVGEANRRFERVEKVVGINGDEPMFLTAIEARLRFQHVDAKAMEIGASVEEVATELRTLIAKNGGKP